MAQDAAKRGQEVYTAQKCQVCHPSPARAARRSPLDGVGAKLADDIRQWITHPADAAAKAKSTKKPPMQDKARHAAGWRHRCSGRMHAELEVKSSLRRFCNPPQRIPVTQRDALLRHPLAIAGAVITTVSAVLFIALVIAMLAGWLNNLYAGLVVFLAIPAAFVIGLLLIPLGMRLQRRKLLRDPNADVDWPVLDFRRAEVRSYVPSLPGPHGRQRRDCLAGGARHPALDGITELLRAGVPHPMHPQFTALQNASHARVACVECHIGEGARGFVRAKLSGVRQLVHVATNSFPRPIPPGAEMPPGAQAQTCAKCHQPGRVVGDRIRVIREYADDEGNAETITVLQMHLSASSSVARVRSTGTLIRPSESSTSRQIRRARQFRTSR